MSETLPSALPCNLPIHFMTSDDHDTAQEKRRRRWQPEEDHALIEAVAAFGTEDWHAVSRRVHGRDQWQCRGRWTNHLRPGLSTTRFTPKEDEYILYMAPITGRKWSEIALGLPGRSASSIKNRWHALNKTRRRHHRREREPMRVQPMASSAPVDERVVPSGLMLQTLANQLVHDASDELLAELARLCEIGATRAMAIAPMQEARHQIIQGHEHVGGEARSDVCSNYLM